MTWIEKDKYYLQNGTSYICKIWLKGEVTYELFHNGTQYAGFKNVEEAKQKFDELPKL